MRIFVTTWSPGFASRPGTGSDPQVPATRAFSSATPSKSGALSVSPCAPAGALNQTWITGTPSRLAMRRQPLDVLDRVLLAAMLWRTGGRKGAALHDDVVLHVLDDERAARGVELHGLAFVGGAPRGRRRRFGRRACGSPRVHERLVARSDLHVDRVEGGRCAHEERAPVPPAPMKIASTSSGTATLAEEPPVRVVDPDAARRRHPDVAEAHRISCRPARRASARP